LVVGQEIGVKFDAPSVPATNVIVVGASAGGITAVRTFLNGLPVSIPAAIFVVVHTSPDGPGLLAAVLGRATPLTVATAEDGSVIEDGRVYVAPPDYHLIVDKRLVHLSHGPREHRFRPAIDPLFRTAARHYGPNTIGIVMSGHMADGTHGLSLVKRAGGVTMVQDPDEAEVPAMPLNAMRQVAVDYVLSAQEMARVIMGLLTNMRSRRGKAAPRAVKVETPNAEHAEVDALKTGELEGPPSPFTCPDCGGTLWEIKDDEVVRYRCHVGHGFTVDSLRQGMDEKIEDTLWTALRAIEEAVELRKRMQARAKRQRLTAFMKSLDSEIADLEKRASALRELLLHPKTHIVQVRDTRKRERHA
jgi:two-component system chemotaxis response regulator CheB